MQYFSDGFGSYSLRATIADSIFASNTAAFLGADLSIKRLSDNGEEKNEMISTTIESGDSTIEELISPCRF